MLGSVVRGSAKDVSLAEIGEIRPNAGIVLLATDGSEPAVRATQHAVLLARLLGAKLKVISVDTGLEELEIPPEPVPDERFGELDLAIQGVILARRFAGANGVDCTAEVLRGSVAGNIIGAATKAGAGVIVIGDTGRTGLRRLALGSVALAVVKASEIPVLVAKAT